ncbi:MAG: hypothetical protein ACI91J_001258 [Yoonia sp.]
MDVVTLDLRADILIDERVEFLRRRFAAGMGIKFGGAGRHQRQQSGDEVGIYPPILQQPEDPICVPNLAGGEMRQSPASQTVENCCVAVTGEPFALVEAPVEFVRIACEAEVAHVPIAMMLHQQIEHGRVQMHVEMTVYMIQSEPGFVELRELGGDLFFEQGT